MCCEAQNFLLPCKHLYVNTYIKLTSRKHIIKNARVSFIFKYFFDAAIIKSSMHTNNQKCYTYIIFRQKFLSEIILDCKTEMIFNGLFNYIGNFVSFVELVGYWSGFRPIEHQHIKISVAISQALESNESNKQERRA